MFISFSQVASINSEILDSALSMSQLTHFYLGLTTEWLNSMKTLMDSSSQKDSFPILVKGVCEMYSLSKLFKALQTALPNSTVKVLKMKQQSTTKQFIDGFKWANCPNIIYQTPIWQRHVLLDEKEKEEP